MDNKTYTAQWKIPHPGTMEWMDCDSFEHAMEDWFEGFNIPRLVVGGEMEDFSVSYARVRNYYGQ
jgi:hypothetical protein